jgi:hypothetical protein
MKTCTHINDALLYLQSAGPTDSLGPDGVYKRAPGHIDKPPEGSPPPDPVTERIRVDLLQRQQVGWRKYGIGLGRGDFTLRDWAQHVYEESLDAAQYAMRIMMTIDGTLPIVGPNNVETNIETPEQETRRIVARLKVLLG